MSKRIKLIKDEKLTIVEAFEKYQLNCKLRNLAEQSIKAQRDKFVKLMKFINDENFLISDFTQKVVDDYTMSLLSENIKKTSVNIYLKYLRIFLNFCSNNSYCEVVKVNMVKVEKEIKQGYSENQLEILLRKPNIKKSSFSEYRNWCIVNFLLGTAVRRTTLINIKIGDLDFENNLVVLRAVKNKKQQIIPMPLSLKEILQEYLSFRGGEINDYLFITSYGDKLKESSINTAIRDYNHKRGVELSGLHGFRRSFATIAIKNNISLFKLQQLLGHSDISTTQKYVRLTTGDLQDNYEEINPLNSILNNNKKTKISMRGK